VDGTDRGTSSEHGSGGGKEEAGERERAKEGVWIGPEKLSRQRRFGDLPPRRWVVERASSLGSLKTDG